MIIYVNVEIGRLAKRTMSKFCFYYFLLQKWVGFDLNKLEFPLPLECVVPNFIKRNIRALNKTIFFTKSLTHFHLFAIIFLEECVHFYTKVLICPWLIKKVCVNFNWNWQSCPGEESFLKFPKNHSITNKLLQVFIFSRFKNDMFADRTFKQ